MRKRTTIFILVAGYWLLVALFPPKSCAFWGRQADADVDKEAYDALVIKHRELKEKLDSLSADYEELKRARESLLKELTDLKDGKEKSQREIDRLKSALSEKDKNIEELQGALMKDALIAKLEKAESEIRQLRRSEKAALKDAEERLKKAQTEINRLKPLGKKLERAEDKLSKAESALKEERRQWKVNKDALLDKAASLERELKKARAQVRKIDRHELKKLKIEKAAELKAERLKIRSRENNLAGELKEKKEEISSLKSKVRTLSKELKYARHAQRAAERNEEQIRKKVDETVKKLNKERLDMHYNLAVVFDNNGMYEDAEREYLKCLKLNPEDAGVHYNLGILYDDKLKDNNKAKDHYETFLELRPKGDDSYKVREWLYNIVQEKRIGPELR